MKTKLLEKKNDKNIRNYISDIYKIMVVHGGIIGNNYFSFFSEIDSEQFNKLLDWAREQGYGLSVQSYGIKLDHEIFKITIC